MFSTRNESLVLYALTKRSPFQKQRLSVLAVNNLQVIMDIM